MKKVIFPLIYVGEWLLFFYILMAVFLLNMIYFANIIIIDMPWEEPITLDSYMLDSILIILGIGIVCYFYLKFLIGSNVYKKLKAITWGILFSLNVVSCAIWFGISFSFPLTTADRVILLMVMFVSLAMTIRTILTFRRES